jgi:hypothetical protein
VRISTTCSPSCRRSSNGSGTNGAPARREFFSEIRQLKSSFAHFGQPHNAVSGLLERVVLCPRSPKTDQQLMRFLDDDHQKPAGKRR